MKKPIITILLYASCLQLFAQQAPDTTNKIIEFKEAVISVNKVEEKRKEVVQQFSTINAKQIKTLNAQNTAELIMLTGNLNVQTSQQCGGSPAIRGFEASRILLTLDNVRMNNLIYRSGHLQNILTFDQNVFERVDILYGPSSTVYGSDALGGVIHMHTRNPQLSNDKLLLNGNAYARYGSINNEKTGHLDLNIAGKRFGSLTSVTYSDMGDQKSGRNKLFQDSVFGMRPYYIDRIEGKDSIVANNDKWMQKFSGYNQVDVLQKFLFKQNKHLTHVVNLQYSTSSDIPRYDRLTELSGNGDLAFAEWYYGPQTRLLAAYEMHLQNQEHFFQNINANINYQNVIESRHNRRYKSNNLGHRTEEVNMLGFNVDFSRNTDNNNFRLGFEGQYQWLNSFARRENIVTGVSTSLDTRYPGGDNTMSNFAVYVTNTFKLNKTLSINAGIRAQAIHLYSEFTDKTFFPFPYDDVTQNNTALSGNLGLVYLPTEQWKFSVLASTGFRAPNVDDLGKVFDSEPGSLIIPNPDLKPEKTYNTELNITKYFGKTVRWENVGFYTWFKDAIQTAPATLNGADSVMYDGVLSRVMASQNNTEAFIYGFSSSIYADLGTNFTATASVAYTYGRIKTDTTDIPLDHIPPLYGRLGLQYQKSKFNAELWTNFNGKKALKDYSNSGEDNLEYATVDGMPAWLTINLRAGYQLNKSLMLQAGVLNILDTQYRTFASGINAAGRSFSFTIRASF